jgi:Flp pilus assembly protein TadD
MRKAEKLANRALVLKQKILGVQHPDTAFSAMHLGFILSEAGREEEARALFTSALAIFERTLAQGHPNVTKCRKLLADEKKS